MGVYTGRRRLSTLPVEEKQPVDKDEEPKQSAGLGALILGFLSSTTAHGLPRVISEPSWIRKFAWLVIFMVASALFCLLMYYAGLEYLKYPVEIDVRYKVRTEAEFPAVTICNLNPLERSELEGTQYQSIKDIDDRIEAALHESRKQNVKLSEILSKSDVHGKSNHSAESLEDIQWLDDLRAEFGFELENQDILKTALKNAANDYDFEAHMRSSKTDDYSDIIDLLVPTKESFDAYGTEGKDFILQCSFDKTHCSYLDFTKVYTGYYGNCFVFNLNATTTMLYGSRYGLRLTLNIEPTEYLGLFSHEAGVRVAVHPANVTAFPEDEGINAPTGYSTSLGVTTSTFTRLPAPYTSMCADGSNHTLLDSNEYTVWSCSLTCLQKTLMRECGCSDMAGLPQSARRCSLTNITQEMCRQVIHSKFKKGQLGCYCPQQCNQVQYNSKVSMSTWPSHSYVPLLWSQIGEELETRGYSNVHQASHALVRLHVYMEDLTVHCTEEHAAYTLEDLLATMGGYLGLFIGISACTMMEFFEFLMDAFGYMAIAMCGGSFVRCMQKIEKETGLPVSSAPIETVKLPPPALVHNCNINKSPRVIHVKPLPDDAKDEDLDVRSLAQVC